MSVKIEKLTPEQQELLPVFREEMRARGLRLQHADDAAMRKAVVELYACAGQAEPKVLVFDSPASCLLARAILLNTQLGDQLWGQLGDQLWGQLRGQLWGQLRDQLGDQSWGPLRDQLRDQLWGPLWDQLGDQLWGQLRGQLWDQSWDQPLNFAGGSEMYWAAYYKFAEMAGASLTDQQANWLDAWISYADTCGCLYPYEGWAFVSRRPTQLSFDDNKLLHAETGPAMSFGDSFSIYAWHGVRVPASWIETPNNITPQEILAVENVEQWAAGVAIIGMDKLLDQLEHKIIDSDPDPERGDLIQVSPPDLPRPGYYLRAQCPRNGRIMEAVNAAEMDEMTVRGAQAWRLGIPASEFVYPERRT